MKIFARTGGFEPPGRLSPSGRKKRDRLEPQVKVMPPKWIFLVSYRGSLKRRPARISNEKAFPGAIFCLTS